MKNQYLFFKEQAFEDFNLTDYKKNDIAIPQTDIHIYEFECKETDSATEELQARILDDLTQRLLHVYKDEFQVISSESSQYFCKELYPLVVSFETKLRYVMYVSRSLYEKNVSVESFPIGKEKKSMEEIDFGTIYEALFTDTKFYDNVRKMNGRVLTKADLIKQIESLEEDSVWRKIVGPEYNYIEKHFLEIIGYRNDVMHNHLIGYETYVAAKTVLKRAVQELERAIDDKLIENKSQYSNKNDIAKTLGDYVTYKKWLKEQREPRTDFGFMIDGVWHTIEVKPKMSDQAALVERMKAYSEFLQKEDEDS